MKQKTDKATLTSHDNHDNQNVITGLILFKLNNLMPFFMFVQCYAVMSCCMLV